MDFLITSTLKWERAKLKSVCDANLEAAEKTTPCVFWTSPLRIFYCLHSMLNGVFVQVLGR